MGIRRRDSILLPSTKNYILLMRDQKQRNFLVHPHIIALYLLLIGLSTLFIAFSISYIYHRVSNGFEPIQLPWLFYVNTAILLATSYILHKTKQYYLEDDTSKYMTSLWVSLVLSILFLFLQFFAWKQLLSSGIGMLDTTLSSFVYLISGVHFLHVIAGIPILVRFIMIAHRRMKEPVSVLIYYSDPDKLRGLEMITTYWHFLDILWIYLVLFFTINYLI